MRVTLSNRTPLRTLPAALAAALAFALGPVVAQAPHWAYRKPARPAVPTVDEASWANNAIDGFVLARIRAAGLAPSSRADAPRALRRLYLDLLGLPPSVEAVERFEQDPSDAAWARAVDELLASPRFGEHWARHWLDLARYADSNGFQADQLRESWAYRDWVIQALNDDMPFDRFTIEQLAGDLLPAATPSQRIATGFHRTVTCNVEAGVHPEANRVNQVVDRVNTTATVWLGTTMECAQCHAHKYDPFSQREYFGLFAFFNNTPIEVENPRGEVGVQYDFCGPWMELPLSDEQVAHKQRLDSERAELVAQRDALVARAAEARADWERDLRARLAAMPAWRPLTVAAFSSTGDEDHRVLDDGSILIEGRVPDTTTYRARVDTALRGVRAVRIDALTHPSLPGTGPGRGDVKRPNFILSEFELSAAPMRGAALERVALRAVRADYEQGGWPVANAVDGKLKTGWAIGGQFGKDHHAIFRTSSPLGGDEGATLEFVLEQRYGRGRTLGRFRLSAFCGDPELLSVPAKVRRILGRSDRTPAQEQRLKDYYLSTLPEVAQVTRALEDVDARLAAIEPSKTLVMVELDEPRETRVLRRGDYLQPAEQVTPHTPAVLHAFDEELPRDRLGLARWLVDEDNPLVARVTVNRWWAQVFGRGLVTTVEDFGARGAAPSHPGLLDWLAVELVESGWSMKHVLRQIVTSETYRQSARRRTDEDPENRLLARGPRFRMNAEMIRDNALAVSGLLSLEMGGPPVFPPQPDGLWRQTGRNEPKYVTATDADRWRRGVYVVWRRAAPYPSFVMFDGPDRAACHPVRSRTNTPMQALALMNDRAYVEAAVGLARRALALRAAGAGERLAATFRLALARRPSAREAAHLEDVLARERARLADEPAAAAALLAQAAAVGVADDLDRVELAAWFHVATVLLNRDEVITKG